MLFLSWGLFLDPDRALLWWKTLIHHIIFGLSTFIPMSFFGFFLFSLSASIPMGFFRVLPLQSKCLYPNGFLRVLPLSTRLFLCEPCILAFGLGERQGIIRRVRLLSVAPPVLGLPFLPCGFGASVVRLFAVKFIQAGEVD